MPELSIILRTLNEAEYLEETLEAVFGQVDAPAFEVLVVDSGSTDRTLAIARKFAVRVVAVPRHLFSYGRALNLGDQAALGPILIHLSAHALPASTHWLAKLVAPLEDPEIWASFGPQYPRGDAPPWEAAALYRMFPPANPGKGGGTGDLLFSNANGAIRKNAWEQLPFDEALVGCEDQVWAQEALRRGGNIAFVPGASVFHSHNEGLKASARRAYNYEISLRSHPDFALAPALRPRARGLLRDCGSAWKAWKVGELAGYWLPRIGVYHLLREAAIYWGRVRARRVGRFLRPEWLTRMWERGQ